MLALKLDPNTISHPTALAVKSNFRVDKRLILPSRLSSSVLSIRKWVLSPNFHTFRKHAYKRSFSNSPIICALLWDRLIDKTFLPLLNILFAIDIPENEFTFKLSPEKRNKELNHIIYQMMREICRNNNFVLVLSFLFFISTAWFPFINYVATVCLSALCFYVCDGCYCTCGLRFAVRILFFF